MLLWFLRLSGARLGLVLGLSVGIFFSCIAIGVRITAPESFHQIGVGLMTVICVYLAGCGVGGTILGALSSFGRRNVIYAYLAGVLGTLPTCLGIMWSTGMQGREIIFGGLFMSLFFGGAVGPSIWRPDGGWD